jgi:DNA invertase Pin-like site-specific DNA recombinase
MNWLTQLKLSAGRPLPALTPDDPALQRAFLTHITGEQGLDRSYFSIDTSGAAGRMMMQMLGSFAEFEREMIRERTRAGLREARIKGRVPGRKPKITDEQKKEIVEAVSSGRKTSAELARLFKIHPATVSRIVSQARVGV